MAHLPQLVPPTFQDSTALVNEHGQIAVSGTADRVPWWSFTKTALAATALRLVEAGSITLDAKIAGECYTLRQLLRHEAGLPDYGSLADYHAAVAANQPPWPVDRLLAATNADRLLYEPGTGWAYSNIGYLKVAQLIEQVSGLLLADALARFILQPANLQSTRLATLPAHLDDVQMASATHYHPGWVYHGLLVGTAADACRLLWMIATDRLLKPKTRREMMLGHALPQFRSATHPDPAYGLGLMLSATDAQNRLFGHRGEGPGSTLVVYALEHHAACVWTSLPAAYDAEPKALGLLAAAKS